MFRLFFLFCSIISFLILFCSGCKDNTIPATFESNQPETEIQSAPPLLANPLQPRPAVNVKELAANETKTEQVIPVTPESVQSGSLQSESVKPELVKPEPVKSETINLETVYSETPLSPTPPVNDIFIQTATDQDIGTTSTGLGFGTPDTPFAELPSTNVTTSVQSLEGVEPTKEAEPTESIKSTEKITDFSMPPKEPVTPKESEQVTMPYIPESPLSSVPVIPSEPFVSDSVPVTPSQVNPLRHETKPTTPDIVQNQTESPTTPDIVQNQTESPTTPDIVQNQTELPTTPDIVQNQTESSPKLNVAKMKTEPLELNVVSSEAKQPFDSITVNGELFVGWEKPKLLLVFTGFLNGYIEPCGCAGLEQMKGGLSRRYTFFKELEEKKGWSILPIDAGNLNKGFGRQEELKFNFVIDEALRLMKYQATGVGNRELLLPTDVLILYFVDVPGLPRCYTSANVAIMQFDPDITAPYRVFEQNGVKVGVTSVIGQSLLKEINNDDIKHEDAVKRLKEILPQFVAEKCDKRILIIHGSAEETKRIVKSMTGQFDYIIPSDTPAEPPFRPNWIDNSMLIEVGEKGKFAVAIGLYDDPNTPFRYQRVPLDSRFENSKTITALMQLYQEQLKETGFQGLGIKPIPNRHTVESGKFIGSKSCADCHELSFSVWKKSRHAAAWRSLAETSKPPRIFDPECIACHVVGWNPVEFLPYEHGFLGETETPELANVGCEACHGRGENHIKAEQGSDTALQEKYRKIIRLPLEANTAKKVCIQCHDGDNSPHFDFETYWKKIIHNEQEE
ncbi:MAG: hypothetical protein LBE12_17785 [Planctomycetaceae bacterium]|jgi:hypothetical protein|nr:hypothetical protein [Planctomycetaceae bacterium]